MVRSLFICLCMVGDRLRRERQPNGYTDKSFLLCHLFPARKTYKSIGKSYFSKCRLPQKFQQNQVR